MKKNGNLFSSHYSFDAILKAIKEGLILRDNNAYKMKQNEKFIKCRKTVIYDLCERGNAIMNELL